MTGLVDVFGGSTVQPSNVAYASVALSATIPTYWPPYVTGTQQPLARLMDVTASTTGLAIKLPDATLAGTGQDVFFNNPGLNTYSVQDSGGNSIATIAAGQQKYLYLSDNTTTNGTWRVTLFGVGSSANDASQLAGSGLKAIGSTLAQSSQLATISANTTFTTADRAKMYVNVGGAITCTFPLTNVVSDDFFLEIRNQGTGTVTLSPSGGELIDGSVSIVLQVNESCVVQSGIGNWYTVGRGRNAQFNFTQLLKTVTGGTTTLSLTEASNVVQTYSGTATGNNTLVLPSVVQVYYISNQVLGGYLFTIQSPTPGTTLNLPYGQNAVVFCDGVNVINASTAITGITSLLLLGGSAAIPPLAFAAVNNGLYAPSSTSIAVSANGVENTRWSSLQQISPSGSSAAPTYTFTGSLTTGLYSPATNQLGLAINGVAAVTVKSTSITGPLIGLPTSETGSVINPSGTTAQRDASPAFGYSRANSQTNQMEWYNGATWTSMGGGATGTGADAAFVENDCVVTGNYTIGQGALLSGVTVTIATPGVFTLANHGFVAGQQIRLTTTGALPTGLAINTAYYVIATGLTASNFQVSLTYAGAAVATSGTQSGVHSVGKIKNAESAGPITVLDSVTVTIPSGASWSIV